MSPVFTFNNKTNHHFGNPILSGKNRVWDPFGGFFAYVSDLFNRKFSLWMTTAMGGTALSRLVRVIVSNGSKKQMRWPNTQRGIAFMEYANPLWYFSSMKFKGSAVCVGTIAINANHAVILAAPCAGPEPAFFSFFDLTPEFILKGLRVNHGCT